MLLAKTTVLARRVPPSPPARIVGRRYRDELAYKEHDSAKHLRQHGFESPEKSCAAIADEQNQDLLRHEAHDAPKNNLVCICFTSVGAWCAQLLEQFYMTIKRTHGISPGAQRPALPAAGERKDWKRETAIAQKKPKKRAESQPSGARIVRRSSYYPQQILSPENSVMILVGQKLIQSQPRIAIRARILNLR